LDNFVLIKADLLLELLNGPIELLASICFEEFAQTLEAVLPGLVFGVCVLDSGNGIVNFVIQGQIRDEVATLKVFLVMETGMVCLLDAIAFRQNALANMVKVFNLGRKPRHGLAAQLCDAG